MKSGAYTGIYRSRKHVKRVVDEIDFNDPGGEAEFPSPPPPWNEVYNK